MFMFQKQKENGVPQLCFHFDSSQISISRIRALAKQVGSSITEKIGHNLIEVKGIRHTRQARTVELALRSIEGMIEVSVSATGMVRVEYDRAKTDESKIDEVLEKEGLWIPDKTVSVERYLRHIEKESQLATETSEKKLKQEHKHGSVFGQNTELILSLISGVLLAIGFALSFIDGAPLWVRISFYIGAYFFGGFLLLKKHS